MILVAIPSGFGRRSQRGGSKPGKQPGKQLRKQMTYKANDSCTRGFNVPLNPFLSSLMIDEFKINAIFFSLYDCMGIAPNSNVLYKRNRFRAIPTKYLLILALILLLILV